MSVKNVSTEPSKVSFSLIISVLVIGAILSGMFYLLEYSPAKSWNVESLAECTLSLEDKTNASLILDQVSEIPRTGKVTRLIEKCRKLREDEKLIRANELMAYAKLSLKTN